MLLTRPPLSCEARENPKHETRISKPSFAKASEGQANYLKCLLATSKLEERRVVSDFVFRISNFLVLRTSVRFACIRHTASVHPEPGSNSQEIDKVNFAVPPKRVLAGIHGVHDTNTSVEGQKKFTSSVSRSNRDCPTTF